MSIKKLLYEEKGASAVEFAIIAPVFIMTLLTFIAFGIYLSVASSIQQIAADAARVAVAGLNAPERNALARNFIAETTLNYYLLQPSKLMVYVQDDPRNADQFTVTLEYDASSLPIWDLYAFAMPSEKIRRFSTIRLGGI